MLSYLKIGDLTLFNKKNLLPGKEGGSVSTNMSGTVLEGDKRKFSIFKPKDPKL